MLLNLCVYFFAGLCGIVFFGLAKFIWLPCEAGGTYFTQMNETQLGENHLFK